MPEDEPYQLVRQDEDDAEQDLDLPPVATPFVQRQNGHTPANDLLPRWARARTGSRPRASLARLFVSIRFILCPTTARTALSLAIFTLLFGLAVWSTKKTPTFAPTPLAHPTSPTPSASPTPSTPPTPSAPPTTPTPEPKVSIFKVSFAPVYADHDTDAFFRRMSWTLKPPCRNTTLTYLFLKGVRDGTSFVRRPLDPLPNLPLPQVHQFLWPCMGEWLE